MYNFIYSSSNEYAPYCLTSICSLLVNNQDLAPDIYIYILSNQIEEQMRGRIRELCFRFSAKVAFIDGDETICKIFERGAKLNFNPSSFLRIFIPELLPLDVEKALFIDSDTYIRHGIRTLYNTDISDYLCAMSYNQPIYRAMLREADLKENDGFFNAGIILLNLAAWRKQNIQNKVLDYYYENGGNFPADDQSVINAIVANNTVVLEYKYNAMVGNFFWSYKKFCTINTPIGRKTRAEFLEARNDPVIIHFNGPGLRPWEKWCAHPYTKEYRRMLLQCNPEYKIKRSPHRMLWLLAQYIKHKVLDKLEKAVSREK